MHHHMGSPVACQTVEPGGEQAVEGGLADTDGGIAQDPVEEEGWVHVVGMAHCDVAGPVGGRVARGQAQGPLVHVDGHDLCLGGAQPGDARDGPPTASKVEYPPIPGGERRCLHKQQAGSRIQPVGREHPRVGRETQLQVADVHRNRPGRGCGYRLSLEVLAAGWLGDGFGHAATVASTAVAPYDIRIIGDPVLRRRAADVADVDSTLVRIVEGMVETMYSADGVGLAAPQIGVQKRLFVWDLGDGPRTIVNPQIVESDGEWVYDEGCLSVPGLSWEIVRPKQVHVIGRDLDGNEVSVEADEIEARLFQHELDHLDGTLLIERLDEPTRKAALRTVRELGIGPGSTPPPRSSDTEGDAGSGGLRLL